VDDAVYMENKLLTASDGARLGSTSTSALSLSSCST